MSELPQFHDFLNHLTDNARSSLKHADGIARSFGSPYIGTEHILLGVLAQDSSIAAKVLFGAGITLDRAKVALNLTPKPISISEGPSKGLSETAKLTLKMSWDVAQEFNQDYCGTEHILFSILSQKNARATILLRDMNIPIERMIGELEGYLSRQQSEFESRGATRGKGRGRSSAVDFFGVDLTKKATKGELDPVVGRDAQIRRMITILNRRTKNNPVLIGEPGVGKTAIVEGLAQRIVDEEVPDALLDKRIIMLDLAGMIAGTKYRGEFEERLKKVMEELVNDKNTLVFVDEVHLLVGAGAAEGAVDAGNILKPALARGRLQLIGATTLDEYSKHIEKDSALERRLQPVIVPETTQTETIAVLKGLKRHYEDYHAVQIDDDVIEEAVKMSQRYINDRFMPDKAIDLLDEAASHIRIDRGKTPVEQRKLKRELKIVTARMEESVDDEDYERAAKYKARMQQINKKLEDMQTNQRKKSPLILTRDDLSTVIATMTGIPVQRIAKQEASFLRKLEKHLAQHVIGQDEAVTAVAKAIRRNRSGIGDAHKPVGSFAFLGPTGVGKTELARVLAREFYGNEDALIKIDMSEFSERHTAARLVGAPAGYVGYDDGGQLTDRVRRQPYSLILFDEIEKAHPDIFNLLLQVLEDGYLSDAKGRKIDFTNTIIIMTSNVGAERLQKEAKLGFHVANKTDKEQLNDLHENNKEKVMDELNQLMRPELINRIDNIIVFNALTKKIAQRILDLQIEELSNRLAGQHLGVTISTGAKRRLLDEGFDAQNGVRPLRKVIREQIEDHIADNVIAGTYGRGDVIKVTSTKNSLKFSLISE